MVSVIKTTSDGPTRRQNVDSTRQHTCCADGGTQGCVDEDREKTMMIMFTSSHFSRIVSEDFSTSFSFSFRFADSELHLTMIAFWVISPPISVNAFAEANRRPESCGCQMLRWQLLHGGDKGCCFQSAGRKKKPENIRQMQSTQPKRILTKCAGKLVWAERNKLAVIAIIK